MQTCRNLFLCGLWHVFLFLCEKVLPLQMKLDVFQMKPSQ